VSLRICSLSGLCQHPRKCLVYRTMAPGFRTFGADCCKACPLALQCFAVALIASLPVACAFVLSGGSLLAALGAASLVILPRLLWRFGDSIDGALFMVALGIYWNLVYLVCFASPFLITACCYVSPWRCLPALGLYLAWTQSTRYELKDGLPWPWFARYEWGYHAFRHFVGLQLHLSDKLISLPKEKLAVLAVHPHGVASDFRILMDGILYEALPDRHVLTLAASVLFRLPLVRELSLWTRCIDASRPVAERALRRGHSLMVLPGGEREQIRTRFQKEEVFLPSMGFVKLALKEGAVLVPCYVFGCVDLYKTYSFLHGPREWLRKKFRVCVPLYSGSIGVLPRRVPLNVVCGAPLDIACATPGQPTDDEVSAACKTYVEALKQLFDTHKEEFGYGERELTVEYPELRRS